MIIFNHPGRLWLLLIVPTLALWIVRGRRRRVRDWGRLGQGGRPRGNGAWAWLVAIVGLVIALGQPTWGRAPGTDLPPGHDVVLLVDTSRSMGAEDAVPDRLGVAVEAAASLVEALGSEPGARAAVVAFAGRGEVRSPLTEYLGAAVDTLHDLHPGDVQPGGTDLGAALDAALDAFDDQERAEGRTIVLFSDGEDHAGSWGPILPRLREAGVIIHAVAIGDPDRGHPIPSPEDMGKPLMYQGQTVLSRRSDVPLEALARATGGSLVPLGLKATDLGRLYRTRISPVARRRREAIRLPERAERFPIFVLGALALGLAGSCPWRGRWPVLAWVAATVLVAGAGPSAVEPAGSVEAGNRAYASGRFDDALAAFDRAIAADPRAAVPCYNAAASLFQLRRFQEAIARYREARDRADAGLRTKIDYALGNAALAVGRVPEAIRHYDDCLASRVPGPVSDAVREDARVNRRFAVALAMRRPEESNKGQGGATPDPTPAKESSTSRKSDDDPAPGAPGSVPPTPRSDPNDGRRSSPPRAGIRGAPQPGSPRARTPEDRLAEAFANVSEARRLRLPDAASAAAADGRKDW